MRHHFVPFFLRSKVSIMFSVVTLAALLGVLVASDVFRAPSSYAQSPRNWSTYLFDNARSGFNASETIINPTSAPNLKLKWTTKTRGCAGTPGGPTDISTQPAVSQNLGLIFWGSWDGCEHATDLSGKFLWSTFIGQINSPNCSFPSIVGPANTATITTLTIGGASTPVILVGGGDANFYALNAKTGAIIWKTLLGPQKGSFLWSSPAVFNGSIYEGLSSQLDCPLVQGQFFQLDATTGAIQNTFNVVPTGCTGGSVWGSPAIDEAAGTLYFGVGNPGTCSQSEPYAEALVELSLSNLAVVGSWQVPRAQQVIDGDFGSTPTLFQATIGGVLQQLVGLENKNGMYYTFVRGNLSQGPVWQATIASGTGSLAEIYSPSAWDGSTLYVAGGHANIPGTSCTGGTINAGSLRALDPATGAFLWQDCLPTGNVRGAVTAVPGVAVVGAGKDMVVVATASGATLFTYTNATTRFYSAASISNGVLYIGSLDGKLYAFAP